MDPILQSVRQPRGEQVATGGYGLWRGGNGTNLVGVPSAVIASADFNAQVRPLHIAGVREMNRELFRTLEEAPESPRPAKCSPPTWRAPSA